MPWMADHWTKKHSDNNNTGLGDVCHREGYSALYVDGHVIWIALIVTSTFRITTGGVVTPLSPFMTDEMLRDVAPFEAYIRKHYAETGRAIE